MTAPRSTLVSLNDTPWYHCVCRCVRRAFLCGEDTVSGSNFEHRRGWIAERLMQLAGIFAIDVAAYAVMNNHYHLVVRIDREAALAWSTEEVLRRWTQLFTGPLLVTRYLSGARGEMTAAEIRKVEELAGDYRNRLDDLSWFMRTSNEYIARKANAEDGVTGRFWEGRFKSQALLDEPALLAAMAYVDLNPVRAGIAQTPETSDYTSLKERLEAIAREATPKGPRITARLPDGKRVPANAPVLVDAQTPLARETLQPERQVQCLARVSLMPFDAAAQLPWAIPFAFDDYLELVDWLGRASIPAKRGQIPQGCPQILERLGIDREQFVRHAERLLLVFGSALGRPQALTDLCARRQAKYLRGMQAARQVFTTSAA